MKQSKKMILGFGVLLALCSCKKTQVISTEEEILNGKSKFKTTTSAVGPPAGQGYQLMFEEEFNGTSYDTNIWFPRVDSTYANGKSRNRAENVKIINGMLEIAYRQISNDPVIHTGGGLITKQLFGYGYYEARVKFFKESKGFHQSFWSLGSGVTSYTRPLFEGGLIPRYNTVIEIDGVEFDSKPGSQIETNYLTYIPTRQNPGAVLVGAPVGEWSIVGYEWLPGKINYYVDGVLKRTVNLTGIYDVYSPQNIWLTGLATPTRLSTEPYYYDFGGHEPLLNSNAKMQVSYVKYWSKRNTSANLIGNSSFEYIQQISPTVSRGYEDPIGWIEPYEAGYNRDASTVEATIHAKVGNNRLKHFAAVDYLTTTKQNLYAIPNGYYKLTAWVKSSAHITPSRMRCLGFGNVERFINIPVTNDWVQITIDDIYVSNNQATIAFTSTAKANEWIFVDDVQFVAK